MTRLRLASSETFKSLHVRNFRLFFMGQGISQIGNWLTLIAQTLLVLQLTDSGVALGAARRPPSSARCSSSAPSPASSPTGPTSASSSSRSRPSRWCSRCALATLAFQDNPPVWAIYVIAFFGGVATAFDNPARRSFVVEMVPEEQITNAVSLNSALMTGSRIIGPALGGILVVTVGFGWAFLLDGISYIAVIVSLRMIDPSKLRPAPVTPRGRGQVRAGLAYAWRIDELRVPLIMMAVIGTLAFNFQTVLPLFAVRDLDGQDLTFSLLMSVVSVGSLLGALRSARRTNMSVRTVSLSAAGFGAAMLALAIAPNQPVAFAVGAVMGFTSILFMTASTAIVQLRADPMMRGRVLALQAIVFLGSTPIGGPIVGTLSERLGARYGLALGAIATLGAAAYGLLTVRRDDALPLTEAVSTAAAADVATDLGEGPLPVRPGTPQPAA